MPLPPGIGFNPPGNGNVDYGAVEGISALQRNPQIRRAVGTGVLNITGSVLYAVWANTGTVTIVENTTGGATLFSAQPSPIVFDQGIPTIYPPTGGALQITPSNLSTVFVTVLYK